MAEKENFASLSIISLKQYLQIANIKTDKKLAYKNIELELIN